MASIHERLTEQFRAWERRGRGWQVYPEPVIPEPPFQLFSAHYIPEEPVVDDGRRPTLLSRFVQRLSRNLSTESKLPRVIPPPEEEPEPVLLSRNAIVELEISLPSKLDIGRESFEQFLLNVSLCQQPISFELIGEANRTFIQFAADPGDVPLLRRQLQAHFPEGTFQTRERVLEQAWNTCEGDESLVVEFGLAHEFMLPLATAKLDPFVGMIGALSGLQEGELGLFQVLFQPVQRPWSESIVRSVSHEDGKPFFVNMPELTSAADKKVSKPLFAAVVRVAVKSREYERAVQIACDLAGSLRVFAHPQGNELIPLDNEEYPADEHAEDVLRRQSRRSGMLLNSEELIGFVHLPSSAVRSSAFERDTGTTKAAPAIVRGGKGLLLGNNVHAGESVPVYLTPEQRVRHTHIIGIHGTGKSTLLFNMIRQDIESGQGVAVLDPHGDLIEQILGIIPQERIDDVVLVDPSDEEYSVGFNILSAHSDLEKNLLASDLVSVFQRLSTSWGDQMGSVLQNAILAFLESNQGGTLADLRRFLLEPGYREQFLKTVTDSEIVYYWRKGFTQLAGNKSIGSVITRLNEFLAKKPIRHMVSQPVNRLDFAQILDTGKIFLAKLSQGQIGRENAFLLGSLFVSKFQQLAMSRQAQQVAQRRDFWAYVDEFQNFITPSMSEILTGARKYRLGLILAHQELRQLERDREVASAVLSNPFTRVSFRVGDSDARALESGLSHFEARSLQNLEVGRAICRVERSDNDFNLSVPFPEVIDPAKAASTRQAVIAASRAKYATRRAAIESALLLSLDAVAEAKPKIKVIVPTLPDVAETAPPELPMVTISEKDDPVVPPVKTPASKASERTGFEKLDAAKKELAKRDLGRGGPKHISLQKRIAGAGHERGFRADTESKIDGSRKSIDVLLTRADLTLACELALTNDPHHEAGNVLKCFEAGFLNVAVVSPDKDHLVKIQAIVESQIDPKRAALVRYLEPEAFLEFLKSIPLLPTERKTTVHMGYKVKSSVSKLSPEERNRREEAAIEALAETMKGRKKRRT